MSGVMWKRPERIEPGPGQESVWDYPRPPALDPAEDRVRVYVGDVLLADSTRAQRVLETSHPPTYYVPPEDVLREHLRPVDSATFCEWKGRARYFDIELGKRRIPHAAWCYPSPTGAFSSIAGYLCFYPSKMDRCLVGDEVVQAQPGDFYGGWITSKIVGPFKGSAGTMGW